MLCDNNIAVWAENIHRAYFSGTTQIMYRKGLLSSFIFMIDQLHKHSLCLLKPYQDNIVQSIPEVWAHKAVDEEVDGGVENDQVPDDLVHQPPLGGDVVATVPFVTF